MAAKPKKATAKTPVKKAAAPKKAAAKPAKRPASTAKKPAAKSPAKKSTPAKSTAKQPAKAPAKKAGAAKKVAAKQPPTKPAPKKVPVTKTPAKKVAVTKAPAKKVAATKAAATKAAANKAPATKAPATKAAAKKSAAKAKAEKPAKAFKPAQPAKPPIELRLAPSRYVELYSDTPKKRSGSSLSPATLDKLKVLLIEERARLSGQADKLTAEAESLVKDRELGDTQFDEESGEGDTISIERERDLVVSAQHRQKIELVDAALARMTNGGYGYCLVCGDRIPVARLEAAPEADMCVKCKSRGERRY